MVSFQTFRTNAARHWKHSCKFSVEMTKYKKVVFGMQQPKQLILPY